MAATIKDFKVGELAFLLKCNGYGRYGDDVQEVEITKVGRKIVTARVGYSDQNFEMPEYDDKSDCFVQKGWYSDRNLLFPTRDSYDAWKERGDLLEWFRFERDRFGSYTTDQLRAAKKILCGETELDRPVKMARRKILCYEGTHDIWSFFVGGERNPCGCGSNCYHYEYDGSKVIGVCNACHRDIYEVLPEFVEEHLNMGTWVEEE